MYKTCQKIFDNRTKNGGFQWPGLFLKNYIATFAHYRNFFHLYGWPLQRQLPQLPSISDMIMQESTSMVFKALNAESPLYLTEQSTGVTDITSRSFCSSNLSLRPPRLKYRHGLNCFAYGGSAVLNSLPSEIKSSMIFGPF